MSELLALSFDSDASPTITLESLTRQAPAGPSASLPYGWGFGWYPGDERAGMVIKDPTSEGENAMSRVLGDWEIFRSTIFVCHIRGVTQRMLPRDVQPFIRSFGGRQWIYAHTGDLAGNLAAAFPLDGDAAFEPVGRTDSERMFCHLLRCAHGAGARQLAELGWEELYRLLRLANAHGTANVVLTDGRDLAIYQDEHRHRPVFWARCVPPHAAPRWRSREMAVDLDAPRDASRTFTMFTTLAFDEGEWHPMAGGQLVVVRRGAVIWTSPAAEPTPERPTIPPPAAGVRPAPGQALARAPAPIAAPATDTRVLSIFHRTIYRYSEPVERSAHLLRLEPVSDPRQHTRTHAIDISVPGLRREYEDVFGNLAMSFESANPFTELVVDSRATVEIRATSPDDLRSPERRDQIPLVWMPWQRQMMLPYLLPVELPETQLLELSEFAMSFVERNDYDLLETLYDINRTIYRDFSYVSGSTTVETTPFDVYTDRKGVCQDFANLMICLARLLNVPARYRAGYIYTGGNYENKVQSEASHAWAEVYLPWVGWRGFDPTNGCIALQDHIRVACGRNYRDATPTSGTLYKGGGTETLTVDVKVEIAEGS